MRTRSCLPDDVREGVMSEVDEGVKSEGTKSVAAQTCVRDRESNGIRIRNG